ncbi:MAG: ATP-binding cassette domain-containing protein [Deltaproteobacteria bacterium]|nr:ATP-binding cassette domain-containing protein [Deltaproteobacteria bacterium]
MGVRLEIYGGTDRIGNREAVERINLDAGDILAVVGPTGSGKSELLADIEQLADGDTPSRRIVRLLVNGSAPDACLRASSVVATLSQRTNFIMDITVGGFVDMHAASLHKESGAWADEVVLLANTLCGEPMRENSLLQRLSGGQTRALMIADIALMSDAPVVLIDEVENAGIDKHQALSVLCGYGKITVMATHDPILMLSSPARLVMSEGGMRSLVAVSPEEEKCRATLSALDAKLLYARELLRKGGTIQEEYFA